MRTHKDMIVKATGCSDDDASMIEEIMRCDIFHSTLDWQSTGQLRRAARQSKAILDEDRALFETHRRQMRDAVARMKTEQAQKKVVRKKPSSTRKGKP